jgi:myo-inositol-1(or 4)-monophosphatase
MSGFRKRPPAEHKGAVELVTDFDRASEALLRERLGGLGRYAVVGEEAGASGAGDASAPTFFVDPLDGTTNFVHGHPFFCVSIGLVDAHGTPVLGAVVAPALGLTFTGWVADDGARASLRRTANGEGEPCRPSAIGAFEDALLATGFPYDRATSPDNNFDAFVAIKKRCQAVRRCGSAALDLCLVADGTYEGYWERKLKPWDVAGGAAVVLAAGGRVTDFDDGPGFMASGHVVATNGRVHGELVAELARVRAARR